jgi:pilus assembly protein FimV
MYRKSAVAAALFFITASSDIHALGLGNIDMRSALNQPMNATIELTSAASTDLSKVSITLASQAAHQRLGLSRSKILNDFDFSIEQGSHGEAVIRITSNGDIHEPFLEFLLEITWPNGHLLREYTVLVDPPITMPATPAAPATPVSSFSAPTQTVQQQRRPAQSAPPAARSSTPATAASADSYGPIRRNETLWSIAEKLRPDTGISMYQMMLALQRKNPQAFTDNNINNLNAGATLQVPSRDEIRSVSASEAYAETRRQFAEWKEGAQPAESLQEAPASVDTDVESGAVVATESRLQLMAPETDAVDGTATSGDPVETEGASSETTTAGMLNQQLALATEEVEASKAQSAEFQSQVSELEEQVETMKRLLELKDEALANMQQRLSPDTADTGSAASEVTAAAEAEQELVDEALTATATASDEVEEKMAAVDKTGDNNRGIINKLMDNPLLAGLGVLVAMLLGGFLWVSTRRKNNSGIFDDEITLEKHMASNAASATKQDHKPPVLEVNDTEQEQRHVSEPANDESDPLTEADVYLAYGRIQQAEDVLQAALATSPENNAIRLKLLEVYHAAGNVAAFDREASDFRDGVTEEDAIWMQVASMGHALSPANDLYRAANLNATEASAVSEMEPMDNQLPPPDRAVNDAQDSDLPESIEYTLDESFGMADSEGEIDEEDASEGLLSTTDEVTTKLDLARAYLDMGDPEGARSILAEVLEEGNDEQKNEAEELISKLA